MNRFDTLQSAHNLDGIGTELRKAARKFDEFNRDIKQTLEKKTLPDKVERAATKIRRKVKASPVFQVAALVAAAVFVGPAVAALLGNIGITSTLVVQGVTVAAKQGISNAVKLAQRQAAETKVKEALGRIQANLDKIDEINRAISADPQFRAIVADMQKRGYTEDQIIAEWSKSNIGKKYAAMAAESVTGPLSDAVSDNTPEGRAAALAAAKSLSADAVKTASPKNEWIVPALLIGAAVLS